MATEGINRLARAINTRIGEAAFSRPSLAFGTIQPDMSLLIDSFPIPIPQTDYLVCRSLAIGSTDSVLTRTAVDGAHMHGTHGNHPHGPSGGHAQYTGDGVHTHPGSEGAHSHPASGGEMVHVHEVLTPESMRWAQPGDRVLVAWIGNDAVVIDIFVSASSIGGA